MLSSQLSVSQCDILEPTSLQIVVHLASQGPHLLNTLPSPYDNQKKKIPITFPDTTGSFAPLMKEHVN